MSLVCGVDANSDLLASLLLPSVRIFCFNDGVSRDKDGRGMLLTACAVRQAGYIHTWIMPCFGAYHYAVLRVIAPCKVVSETQQDLWPEWVMYRRLSLS
jgi:hypothetical protein